MICLQLAHYSDILIIIMNTVKKEVTFSLLTKRERAAAESRLVSRKGEVPFGVAQLNFQ
jgi:hypothetical protein